MSCKKSSRRRRGPARQGAAVVEAAVMLPLLVIVTLGAIDVAQYINSGQAIANASRVGARVASRNETKTVGEVRTAVTNYLEDIMPQLTAAEMKSAVTISVQAVSFTDIDTDGDGVYDDTQTNFGNIPSADLTTVTSGSPIAITVEFDFDEIRWLQGPSYANHSIRTICRRD